MYGAYLEQNVVNGKFYAGKGEWLKRHRERMSVNLNANSPAYRTYICKAYRKHGAAAFIPHTVCWFDTEEAAFEQERQWIAELDLMNHSKGYNLTLGGEGASGLHFKMPPRTIRQLAQAPINGLRTRIKQDSAKIGPRTRRRGFLSSKCSGSRAKFRRHGVLGRYLKIGPRFSDGRFTKYIRKEGQANG